MAFLGGGESHNILNDPRTHQQWNVKQFIFSLSMSCVLSKNSLEEPIPLQVNNKFDFKVFLLDHYHTKVKEPDLPYYLPVAGKRIVGCIPFPNAMQKVSSLLPDLISSRRLHFLQW